MSYPNPSDFLSPSPFSAWWFYSVGGVQNVCEATGAAIIRRARQNLGLPVSLVWDQVLIDRLRAVDAGDPMRTAIAVAYYGAHVSDPRVNEAPSANTRPISGITIPSGARLPSVGQAVANDSNAYGGRMVAFNPTTDPPPESLTSAALNTAMQQSETGLRLGPDRPEPQFNVSVLGSGSVLGPVGVGVAAVIIVGAAWWWSRR